MPLIGAAYWPVRVETEGFPETRKPYPCERPCIRICQPDPGLDGPSRPASSQAAQVPVRCTTALTPGRRLEEPGFLRASPKLCQPPGSLRSEEHTSELQ